MMYIVYSCRILANLFFHILNMASEGRQEINGFEARSILLSNIWKRNCIFSNFLENCAITLEYIYLVESKILTILRGWKIREDE